MFKNDTKINLNYIQTLFYLNLLVMEAPCNEIIDDIEDLISSQDITPKERYSTRKNVKVRARKKKVSYYH